MARYKTFDLAMEMVMPEPVAFLGRDTMPNRSLVARDFASQKCPLKMYWTDPTVWPESEVPGLSFALVRSLDNFCAVCVFSRPFGLLVWPQPRGKTHP